MINKIKYNHYNMYVTVCLLAYSLCLLKAYCACEPRLGLMLMGTWVLEIRQRPELEVLRVWARPEAQENLWKSLEQHGKARF